MSQTIPPFTVRTTFCEDRDLGIFGRGKDRGSKGRFFLVVGLGNPTSKYENTRHNVGFMALDAIADRYGISVVSKKHNALVGRGRIGDRDVMLAKPQTYMNCSGDSVREIVEYYKLDPKTDMLVIYDDISLEPGRLRIRLKGSAGGHNGVKDIIDWLDTDEFSRIKIGVGEKPSGWDLKDHVLGHFAPDEKKEIDAVLKDVTEACEIIVNGDPDRAMNMYNGRTR